jgi:hypothetical protein
MAMMHSPDKDVKHWATSDLDKCELDWGISSENTLDNYHRGIKLFGDARSAKTP